MAKAVRTSDVSLARVDGLDNRRYVDPQRAVAEVSLPATIRTWAAVYVSSMVMPFSPSALRMYDTLSEGISVSKRGHVYII